MLQSSTFTIQSYIYDTELFLWYRVIFPVRIDLIDFVFIFIIIFISHVRTAVSGSWIKDLFYFILFLLNVDIFETNKYSTP